MRKVMAVIIGIMLLLSPGLADDEAEDLTIIEVLEHLPGQEEKKLTMDSDHAIIMTVTCTGDFTIGGDNYHKKGKKFYDELDKCFRQSDNATIYDSTVYMWSKLWGNGIEPPEGELESGDYEFSIRIERGSKTFHIDMIRW